MKKVLFLLLVAVCTLSLHAETEVTLSAGTMVPLRSTNAVRAAHVKKGDAVMFTVARDIRVNDILAIPYGTTVKGHVLKAKRSAWFGTKGRLKVEVNEIVMPNGTVIPLDNGITSVFGKNMTTASVICFIFTLVPFAGTGAEMQAGYEFVANVAANTKLKVQ